MNPKLFAYSIPGKVKLQYENDSCFHIEVCLVHDVERWMVWLTGVSGIRQPWLMADARDLYGKIMAFRNGADGVT